LARVPLASGLLTGKFKFDSTFHSDDHRNFNRHGEEFDRGETFSGVDFESSLKAIDELKAIAPPGMNLAQFALRWILMFQAVTCAIPGAKRRSQEEQNAAAGDLPPLSEKTMAEVRSIYDRHIRGSVHNYW
jgi:aryl-alcohol dehydrogenase-like predicted oxidoreductase